MKSDDGWEGEEDDECKYDEKGVWRGMNVEGEACACFEALCYGLLDGIT